MIASTRTAESSENHDAEASIAPTAQHYERDDFDRYIVHDNGPVGYVEAVPPVFVCYVGYPYTLAHEIAQVHDFHRAVELVREISLSSPPPKIQA